MLIYFLLHFFLFLNIVCMKKPVDISNFIPVTHFLPAFGEAANYLSQKIIENQLEYSNKFLLPISHAIVEKYKIDPEDRRKKIFYALYSRMQLRFMKNIENNPKLVVINICVPLTLDERLTHFSIKTIGIIKLTYKKTLKSKIALKETIIHFIAKNLLSKIPDHIYIAMNGTQFDTQYVPKMITIDEDALGSLRINKNYLARATKNSPLEKKGSFLNAFKVEIRPLINNPSVLQIKYFDTCISVALNCPSRLYYININKVISFLGKNYLLLHDRKKQAIC